MDIVTITLHAIEAHLWADAYREVDGEPETVDARGYDVTADDYNAIREDVGAFVEANADALTASGLSDEQIGHDFALTRNGHGAGFWDRGLGELGDALTAAAKPFDEVRVWLDGDTARFEN